MTNKRSNVSVDLVRIFAIFIVIMLHTASWYTLDGKFLKSEGMIYSFLQDGIPLLWYALGMSLFRGDNTFGKTIVNTGKSIVLPSLVYVLIAAVLGPWLAGREYVTVCLSSLEHVDWRSMLGSICRGNTSGLPMGGHLWFVFSYLKIILWFPLLRYVCANEKTANTARRYLILLALASELVADVQQFLSMPTAAVNIFTILNSDLLYVLLGYELSLWLDTLRTKRALVFCAGSAVFFIANVSRFLITKWFYDTGYGNQAFMHIEHIVSVFSSMGLMTAIMMIEPRNNTVNKVISNIADHTFLMYLAHWAVFNRLNVAGNRDIAYEGVTHALSKLSATVRYGILVFIVSLAAAVAARAIYRFVKALVLGRQA